MPKFIVCETGQSPAKILPVRLILTAREQFLDIVDNQQRALFVTARRVDSLTKSPRGISKLS